MTLTVWRIVQKQHAKTAFSGAGAALYPGRWNAAGTPVVYTAESRALALLEILANLGEAAALDRYVLISARFGVSLCRTLTPRELPRDWDTTPPAEATRTLGTAWCQGQASVALKVPSVLVPGEFNVLLNPRHPAFRKVRVGAAEPVRIDRRLVRGGGG